MSEGAITYGPTSIALATSIIIQDFGTVCVVATLIPEDLDLESLHPESERGVIRQLLRTLGDDWQIIPKVGVLIDNKNAEIDLVLASRHRGVFVLEVKGGTIAVRDGQWYQNNERLKTDPFLQIANAKHQLARRLKAMKIDLDGLFINEVVVLPDVGDIPRDGLGPNAPRSHCWTSQELQVPEAALAYIRPENSPVPKDQYLRFLRALCPKVELTDVEGRFVQGAVQRLDSETKERLDVAARLGDTNRTFLVTGSVGTGKTYLAERWARRCATRGERTLVVCYNRPISEDIAQRLDDTDITVHTFHRLVELLLKPLGFVIPESPPTAWWRDVPAQELLQRVDDVRERFDAIIVDEAQDFSALWIRALEALLSPSGPRRLLMLADPDQTIYAEQWSPPLDMPSLKLETNLRSSRVIARRVQAIGGAAPNRSAPEGAPVREREASIDTVVSVLAEEIERLRGEYDIPPSQFAILTRHTSERDLLLSSNLSTKIARWEDRDETRIVCETIHRTKGLERLAIIYIDLDAQRSRKLEYVGIGRAMLHLVAITATASLSTLP